METPLGECKQGENVLLPKHPIAPLVLTGAQRDMESGI